MWKLSRTNFLARSAVRSIDWLDLPLTTPPTNNEQRRTQKPSHYRDNNVRGDREESACVRHPPGNRKGDNGNHDKQNPEKCSLPRWRNSRVYRRAAKLSLVASIQVQTKQIAPNAGEHQSVSNSVAQPKRLVEHSEKEQR